MTVYYQNVAGLFIDEVATLSDILMEGYLERSTLTITSGSNRLLVCMTGGFGSGWTSGGVNGPSAVFWDNVTTGPEFTKIGELTSESGTNNGVTAWYLNEEEIQIAETLNPVSDVITVDQTTGHRALFLLEGVKQEDPIRGFHFNTGSAAVNPWSLPLTLTSGESIPEDYLIGHATSGNNVLGDAVVNGISGVTRVDSGGGTGGFAFHAAQASTGVSASIDGTTVGSNLTAVLVSVASSGD